MSADNNAELPESTQGLSLTATAVIVVGGRLYGMAVSIAAIAVVARVLSPAEFGAFAFALSLLYVSSGLARFGFDRLILKLTAERLANNDDQGYRQTQRGIYSCVLITSSLVSLALLSLLLLKPAPQQQHAWLLLVVGCPAMAFTQVIAENFRGLGNSLRATLFDTMRTGPIVNTAFLLGVILGRVFFSERLHFGGVLSLFVGSHLILLLVASTQLLRTKVMSDANGRPTQARKRMLLKMAAPIAGSDLVSLLTANIDIWIATYYLTNQDVANLAVLLQLGLLVACPLTMASAAVSQRIAELTAKGELVELQRVLRSAATLATVTAICVIVPIFFFGAEILTIFYGPEYSGSARLLMIHCAGKLAFTATGVAGLLLILTTRQKLLFVLNLGVLVIFTLGGGVATYFWKLEGLVVAGCLIVAAQNLLTCLLARRTSGVWTHTYLPGHVLNRIHRPRDSVPTADPFRQYNK